MNHSKSKQKILICDTLEDTIIYQVELLFEDIPILEAIRNIKGLRYLKRAIVIFAILVLIGIWGLYPNFHPG